MNSFYKTSFNSSINLYFVRINEQVNRTCYKPPSLARQNVLIQHNLKLIKTVLRCYNNKMYGICNYSLTPFLKYFNAIINS